MIRGKIRVSLLGPALAIFLSAPAWAQEPVAVFPDEAAKEGITVHGHWTIEVFRDGEIVSRQEFENALSADALAHIANLLHGTATSGNWLIRLRDSGGDPPCLGPSPCFIEEANGDLTVTSPEDGGPAELVLSGSVTAERDGTIDRVGTLLRACANTEPASSCTEGVVELQIVPFSLANLSSPEVVQTGDQINATVEFVFSG